MPFCTRESLTYPGLVPVVERENLERSLAGPKVGTQTIDIELVVTVSSIIWKSRFHDRRAPGERGIDAGLPPLAYFIAGAASCLMTQYTKFAIARTFL